MRDIIAQEIRQMTRSEKMELLESLERMVAEEMASASGAPCECPRCKSADFVRKGRDRNGAQRWLCHGCGRSFGAATRGLLANSKLDAGTWREFARCMVDCVPLRECARRCGTSLTTAWFMRRRMCEVMASGLVPFRAGQGTSCQVDGEGGGINMVNALHSRLREFLMRFHGVATRRLQHCLDWFCYREQFRKTDADRRDITFADAASGRYSTSRRGYAKTPHPFMEYWGGSAMSTLV